MTRGSSWPFDIRTYDLHLDIPISRRRCIGRFGLDFCLISATIVLPGTGYRRHYRWWLALARRHRLHLRRRRLLACLYRRCCWSGAIRCLLGRRLSRLLGWLLQLRYGRLPAAGISSSSLTSCTPAASSSGIILTNARTVVGRTCPITAAAPRDSAMRAAALI